jgi:hypothetical protein
LGTPLNKNLNKINQKLPNLEKAPSVYIGPGLIPLNLIPYLDHSTANDLVIAQIPDFAHADGTTKPLPVSAYVVIIDKNEAAFLYKIYKYYF